MVLPRIHPNAQEDQFLTEGLAKGFYSLNQSKSLSRGSNKGLVV